MADYLFLLETRLTPSQQAVVSYLQGVCHAAGLNLYLTGGPLRDLLAGSPIRTLDFTTEGSPLALQNRLAADGVQILLADSDDASLRLRQRGVRFRLSSAQAADYTKPGQPVMRPGTIIEDLRRRGFTLNSIGLSLNEGSRGLLLDPTNGLADIEARLIRMNHNYVFLNDPVRLLRAVRLQSKLGFAIEERTAGRMQAAREGEYLQYASKNSLGLELEALIYEPDAGVVLQALEAEGLLEPAFGPGFQTRRMNLAAMARVPQALDELEQAGLAGDPGPVTMYYMLHGLSPKDQSRLVHLQLSKPLVKSWQKLEDNTAAVEEKLASTQAKTLADLEALLKAAPPEAVLFLTLGHGHAKGTKRLREYLAQVPRIKQRLPMRELQQMGLSPATPAFQQIMLTLYQQLLLGELSAPEQLLAAMEELARASGALPKPEEKEKPMVRGKYKGGKAGAVVKPVKAEAKSLAPSPSSAPAPAPSLTPAAAPAAAKAEVAKPGKLRSAPEERPPAPAAPKAAAKVASKPEQAAKPATATPAKKSPPSKAKAASKPAAKEHAKAPATKRVAAAKAVVSRTAKRTAKAPKRKK